MINLIADNKEVEVKWLEFSDGALTCKIDPIIKNKKFAYISLSVDPSTPCKQVLEEINLVTNALTCLGVSFDQALLYLPYLPYARADRIFEEGNPNPLYTFLMDLGLYEFDSIYIKDIHNKKLIPMSKLNIVESDQLDCFINSIPRVRPKWTHVISPDKGATEKAKSIADYLDIPVVQANKKRDISTGTIIDTTLDVDMPVGSSVIIVDDLLDGGGTFIPLANKLRSQGCTVDLYVTHLIAAKGLDLFKGLIDNIYCYHVVGKYTTKEAVMNFNLGK